MHKIDYKVHLSYNDILLVPYDQDVCTVKSRNDPDISTEVCPGKKIKIPIVSAPMDTVTGYEMTLALDSLGALGIYTRHINDEYETQKQIEVTKKMGQTLKGHKAIAIGVKTNNIYDLVSSFVDNGLDIICLDIANGNHIYMIEALREVSKVKNKHPQLSVIA